MSVVEKAGTLDNEAVRSVCEIGGSVNLQEGIQSNEVHEEANTQVQQKWNEPRGNMFRFLCTTLAFLVMGMNTGALGALIPYIETYYDIPYTIVSLLFLAAFGGYLLAALLNNLIHYYIGQFGIAVLAPLCRLAGFIPIVFHPQYPVLPVILVFPSFGSGLEDSAWNAWVGNLQNANELLGILHSAWGIGATIGPLIATAMVSKAGLPWYSFYYVMCGLSGVQLVLFPAAFWSATGKSYRETHLMSNSKQRTTTRQVLRDPVTWIIALILLSYVGAEVSLGGWIVTFMLRVRHADPFTAGLTVTFFWLGIAVGRLILGFVTGRIGEKMAMTVYLLLSIGLQILYWLVPHYIASAVFVALLGFFLAPLFPAVVVSATKLLPSDYHVSAIGFAAAFGGGGAAVFPFMVGAIAQSKGIQVLQPIVLAMLILILLLWLLLPGGFSLGGLERARDRRDKPGQNFLKGYRWIKERLIRSG